MSLRRVGGLAAAGLAILLCTSCGQVYRPVVLPINNTPPNPAGFHAVFAISTNTPFNLGAAMQIDVSGDSTIGQAYMGVNPTHAGILPNNSRVFVASAGSLFAGDTDIVTAFTPAVDAPIATGLGTPTVFSYPSIATIQSTSITAISEDGSGNVTVTLASALSQAVVGRVIEIAGVNASGSNPFGYNGSFSITVVNGATIQYVDPVLGLPAATGGTAALPVTCSYLPDYVTTAQATAVFVANYGAENNPNCNLSSTDSVSILSPALNSVSLTQYLTPGSHPVAMVETPDAFNLYVLNQNNTILNLSPADLSTRANIPLGASTVPVWAVARPDAQAVYVLTQGDGVLHTISPASNTIVASVPVGGPGANFVLYDPSRSRLYVTNPVAGSVFVFDATAYPAPTLLGTVSMSTGANAPCPTGCSPVSVAALPDGSRFYVASYETFGPTQTPPTVCPDPTIAATATCIVPLLTVYDAASLTVKPVSSTTSTSMLPPSISLFGAPLFSATQFATTEVTGCAPPATYTPAGTRFRLFAAASADSSHVYVAMCDAGAIADVATSTTTLPTGGTNTPDTFITDLAAPLSAPTTVQQGTPPPQSPVFLLTGQ